MLAAFFFPSLVCGAAFFTTSAAVPLPLGLPREIAQELVEAGGPGAFVVRESQSAPGNYALTLMTSKKIVNFIIRHHKVRRSVQRGGLPRRKPCASRVLSLTPSTVFLVDRGSTSWVTSVTASSRTTRLAS